MPQDYFRSFAKRIEDAEGTRLNRLDKWGRPMPDDGAVAPTAETEAVVATPLGRLSPTDRLTGRVDWDVIRDLEGVRLNGYVPTNQDDSPNAKSGVTIAAGFDLGGRTPDTLRQLGMPGDLVEALTPYLRLRGQAAQDYLNENPLTITPEHEEVISALVFQDHYDRLARRYNAATGGAFQDLPRDAQTAIMSVAFQYGPNLPSATPEFWRQLTGRQWQDAQKNLGDFGDSWRTRRRAEAGLLGRAIEAGNLPRRPAPLFREPVITLSTPDDPF